VLQWIVVRGGNSSFWCTHRWPNAELLVQGHFHHGVEHHWRGCEGTSHPQQEPY